MGLLWETLTPALLFSTCSLNRLLLALLQRRAAIALAVPIAILVAIPIAILVAIPIAETAMVASEGTVVSASALLSVARLVASVLARWRLRLVR